MKKLTDNTEVLVGFPFLTGNYLRILQHILTACTPPSENWWLHVINQNMKYP